MLEGSNGGHDHGGDLQEYELSEEVISRRRFLSYITGVLTAVIALLLGIPLVSFVVGPLFTRKASPWVRLGGVTDIKSGEPTKFMYSYQRLDGWHQKTVRGTAYVVSKDGADLTVFSNLCSHLGCGVRWDSSRQAFLCPCHNGGFDINGKVVMGPPPRPLDKLDHKVEGGIVFIKMREG